MSELQKNFILIIFTYSYEFWHKKFFIPFYKLLAIERDKSIDLIYILIFNGRIYFDILKIIANIGPKLILVLIYMWLILKNVGDFGSYWLHHHAQFHTIEHPLTSLRVNLLLQLAHFVLVLIISYLSCTLLKIFQIGGWTCISISYLIILLNLKRYRRYVYGVILHLS